METNPWKRFLFFLNQSGTKNISVFGTFYIDVHNECLARNEFASYAEAYRVVSEFIKKYNNRRPHSSLKYHTPAEAYTLIKQNLLKIKEIRA